MKLILREELTDTLGLVLFRLQIKTHILVLNLNFNFPMCRKAIIVNKSQFGSLSTCVCGSYYFSFNHLSWRFSKEELQTLIKTIHNIDKDDWEFTTDTMQFHVKIPLTLDVGMRYLICNQNEFNHLKFIFTEHLTIDQLLKKSTDQSKLN